MSARFVTFHGATYDGNCWPVSVNPEYVACAMATMLKVSSEKAPAIVAAYKAKWNDAIEHDRYDVYVSATQLHMRDGSDLEVFEQHDAVVAALKGADGENLLHGGKEGGL